MIKRLLCAVMLLVWLAFPALAEQTLPGVSVFSPGLLRLGEKLAAGERVEMSASLGVSDMLYVRNVFLLRKMLSGASFVYAGEGTAQQGMDSLRIERDGETLLDLSLLRAQGGAQLSINGQAYGLDLSAQAENLAAVDALSGAAILERVPLGDVRAFLASFAAGDALAGGFAVVQPLRIEDTYSDDGLRLTRIDISGSIARDGEAPWVIEGYLRQPGGRSPKDTFEITLTQDEENFIELSYSAARESTVTRKNKAGEMAVDTTLKAAGEIEGHNVTTRLTVRMRNAWTADGENLKERITISATLGHTDKTPGRRMLRLNDMSGKLKTVISLTTSEAGNPVIALEDETTLSLIFDDNTLLDVSADARASVGGEGEGAAMSGAPEADEKTLRAALDEAVLAMTQKIYAQLDEDTRKTLESGL